MFVRNFVKAGVACLVVSAVAIPVSAQQKTKDGIEKCATPIGTIAINEPEADQVRALSGYNLGSPASVLRILIQESNCFLVVERGSGLTQMKQERELAQSGNLRSASNVGGGLFTVLTNIEYGFKPAPPLKLRAFYDSGNAWENVDQVDWNRPYLYPSYGVGMLFTIPTSVIQIRLDWGFPLDPNFDIPGGRIHFNIGNIF